MTSIRCYDLPIFRIFKSDVMLVKDYNHLKLNSHEKKLLSTKEVCAQHLHYINIVIRSIQHRSRTKKF